MRGARMSSEMLALVVEEIRRQEVRVDAKAQHLAQLAGVLAAVIIAVISGLGATFLLMFAAVPWCGTVLVLVVRVLRPTLPRPAERMFQLDTTADPDTYNRATVERLAPIVLRRFRNVRLAIDLLVLGFVALLAAVGYTAL